MAAPYLAGQNTFAAGSISYTLTITAAVAATDGLVLCAAVGGSAPPAIISVTDNAGGSSWAKLQETTASPYIATWQRTSATALAISAIVTVTFAAAATGAFSLAAAGFPGLSSLDLSVVPAGATSTTASITGTPANSGETALAVFSWANVCGAGTIGGTGTQLTQQHAGTAGSYQTLAYVPSPAPGSPLTVSYTVVSGSWRATLVSFRASSLAAAAAVAGQGSASAAATVTGVWYMSNASFINSMDASNHPVTLAAFGGPQNFSINNTASSVTSLPAGYSTTPLLKYISYGQMWADVTGSAKTVGSTTYTPVAISAAYQWLMYDTENWNPNPPSPYASPEDQAEIDDPWTYMANFVNTAHVHGYKVLLAPARDLGSDATSVHPNTFGSLDAWYEGTGIATAMATAGADIAHIQSQADQNSSQFALFFSDGLAKVRAVSAIIPVSAGVSTTSPAGITAAQMAASAQTITPAGYWLNASTATISTAVAFLQDMQAGVSAAPGLLLGAGTASARAAVAVRAGGAVAGAGMASATVTASQPVEIELAPVGATQAFAQLASGQLQLQVGPSQVLAAAGGSAATMRVADMVIDRPN